MTESWTERTSELLREALVSFQQGNYSRAERLCETILSADRLNFVALNMLGVILCQSGRASHALALIDKAIAINPNVSEAHNNRGNALHELRRFEEAIESFDKAILLNSLLEFCPRF